MVSLLHVVGCFSPKVHSRLCPFCCSSWPSFLGQRLLGVVVATCASCGFFWVFLCFLILLFVTYSSILSWSDIKQILSYFPPDVWLELCNSLYMFWPNMDIMMLNLSASWNNCVYAPWLSSYASLAVCLKALGNLFLMNIC